jgi:hypothetical protein
VNYKQPQRLYRHCRSLQRGCSPFTTCLRWALIDHAKEIGMRFSVFVVIAFFFIVGCAQQSTVQGTTPPQPVQCPGITSPDQQLRACVLSVGRHPDPPFNESRVEIRNMKSTVLAAKDFKSPDGEHGRNVQKMECSPNSQFFAFSTASSGGHSPWHWQTYFYDRKTRAFKEVDDFTGPIIKRNFKLTAPDWIEVQVQGTAADPSDITNGHSEKRRLSALH